MSAEQVDAVEVTKGYIKDLMIGLVALAVAYGLASYCFLTKSVRIAWEGDTADLLYVAPASTSIYALPFIVAGLMCYFKLKDIVSGTSAEKWRVFKMICFAVLVATVLSAISRGGLYRQSVQEALPAKYSLWVQAHVPLVESIMSWKGVCAEVRARSMRYGDYRPIDMSSVPERLHVCDFSPDGEIYLTDRGKDKVKDAIENFAESNSVSYYWYIELLLILISSGVAVASLAFYRKIR